MSFYVASRLRQRKTLLLGRRRHRFPSSNWGSTNLSGHWLFCALLQCILAFQKNNCIATVQGRRSVQHRQSRRANWCLDSLTSSADSFSRQS